MNNQREQQQVQEIVAGFLNGDTREYRAIRSRISWYLSTLPVGLDGERDQITADVLGILTECLRNNRFRGDSVKALNFYIYGIIRNRTKNILRKDWRLVRQADAHQTAPDQSPLIDRIIADRDLVKKIIGSLDERSASLLRMKFEDGYSDQEIADALGMTKNAVSTAISRCIKKVQNLDIIRDLQ